ncbi:endoglucanase EG-1 [Apiospora phragmitis]|uniref:Glucanase n=1 Tax=Apiospora phragmitis TaxID=2905665 RepID=A0ABR1TQT2_9PEZI
MARNLTLPALLAGLAAAQKPVGTETHPKLTTYRCTVAGGCTEATNYIVLDSSSHWVHQADGSGCGDWGSGPNATACPTVEACAEACVMEGVSDYSTVGVATAADALTLTLLVDGQAKSPRVYLLDETEQAYEMTKFAGGEYAFDVDVSKLPCGMNGALYLSEMEAAGGKSDLNPGGAYWGTGYCDAQCYVTPFQNGIVRQRRGQGRLLQRDGHLGGQLARHADRAAHVQPDGPVPVRGGRVPGRGVCDKNGCGWNNYRLDQPAYYGRGGDFTVDTTRPFTVVTQFPAGADGQLLEIERLYVQDGVVIKSETVAKAGTPAVDSITDEFCAATGAARFADLGALRGMGDAMARGMVLAMSIWWDAEGAMVWLDGSQDGAGPCSRDEDKPDAILAAEPDPTVVFSKMKWGEIGSTFTGTAPARRHRALRN